MPRRPRRHKRTKGSKAVRLVMLKRKLAKGSNNKTHPETLTGETMKEQLGQYDNLLDALVRYCAFTV